MQKIFAISLYFLVLFFFAKAKQKKSLTQEGFVIGERSLNRWTTALAAHASDMSNWLFMAYPGMVFVSGGKHIWVAIGLVLMMWANWLFIAPKIRVSTERTRSVTLSDFFEQRLNQNWPIGRMLTSVALFLFYTVYVSAALSGVGVLFQMFFPISYAMGVLIGISLILPFVLMGGYLTLARVDLFQGVFLLGVIFFVPFYIMYDFGGVGAIIRSVHAQGKSFSLFSDSIWKDLFLMFGWGLGYFGQPHILTKFMGIRDPKQIGASKKIGMSWQILSLAAATSVGFVGIATLPNLEVSEQVFIAMVESYFPPFFSGIFLCAILAAILNAVSSMLLVLSTTITEDLFKSFARKNLSGGSQIFFSRLACLLAALIAMGIALFNFTTIDKLVLYAWSGLGAIFGPLVIATLYFREINSMGNWLGMGIGAGIVAFSPLIGIADYSLVIAFPAALGAIFIMPKIFRVAGRFSSNA